VPQPDFGFLDLRATHNSHRWYLPVTNEIAVGPPDNNFMFGGVGLAASVAAMEATCKRPVIWATAQYLSYARPGSIVDLDVKEVTIGKSLSQVRVSAHVGEPEILTVNAALGARQGPTEQWVKAPAVAPPEDCPAVTHWRAQPDSLNARFETRLARGRFGERGMNGEKSDDGRLTIWIRAREGFVASSTTLAIMADFVPSGIANALGYHAGGNSLDNTIRFCAIEPVEWVLCDIRIEAVAQGLVHGKMRLFTPAGHLMASASQSMILREHGKPG
jgi:acyl-CoA thioesterase